MPWSVQLSVHIWSLHVKLSAQFSPLYAKSVEGEVVFRSAGLYVVESFVKTG